MRKRTLLFSIVFMLVIVESFSAIALYILDKGYAIRYLPADKLSEEHVEILDHFLKQDSTYINIDPILGWAPRPNGKTGLYRANPQGLRGVKTYPKYTSKRLRISTFGDSFTHGNDVRFEETWQYEMERLDSTLEALNFGVGGYGLDQTYLRFLQEKEHFNSDIVLVGFMTVDIYRHQNLFRPFFASKTGLPFGKPRFELVNGDLKLTPNPFPTKKHYDELMQSPESHLIQAGENDFYYQRAMKSGPFDFFATIRLLKIASEKLYDRFDDLDTSSLYREEAEPFQLTCRIFYRFCEEVKKSGADPIIILFPNRDHVIRYKQTGENHFSSLYQYFDENNLIYVDLLPLFSEKSEDVINQLIPNHYSAVSNKMVAEYIFQFLDSAEKN